MVTYNEYIEFIKKYFNENLSEYCLKTESFYGPFWHVEFTNDEILIILSGDIGFHIEIDFYGKKYPLWQHDYSVSQKTQTNFENLDYQLKSLENLIRQFYQ